MTQQGFDRPAQHRLAADRAELFWNAAAETLALTSCDDESDGGHGGGV
jgi:hypothetical protein